VIEGSFALVEVGRGVVVRIPAFVGANGAFWGLLLRCSIGSAAGGAGIGPLASGSGARSRAHCAPARPCWGWLPCWAEHLASAVPLHDIGKVAIPDALLRKPGAFSAQEQ